MSDLRSTPHGRSASTFPYRFADGKESVEVDDALRAELPACRAVAEGVSKTDGLAEGSAM